MNHLRPANSGDEPLLFALFAEQAAAPLAASGLPEQQVQMLVQMQYRGRKMTYAARHPQAEQWILCAEDGTAVGHLLLNCQPQCWRIVDIAVAAACRGRGLGTSALRQVQEQCRQAAALLELNVMPQNPARRLYERLGFHAASEDAQGMEMVWSAAGQG